MDIMKAESDADDEKVKVSGDSYCNWIDTKEEVDPLLMTFPSVKLESERDLDCVKAETDGDNETGMVSTNSYDDLIDIKEEMIPVVTFPAVTSESQKASCDSSETAELPSEEMTDEIHERTESNIDVVEEIKDREDGVGLMLDEEEEEETESAFQNRRESWSKDGRKFGRRLDKERDVDKVITFMQENERDRRQPGELEYFFASVCQSTKHLPRCFQLRVKQDVMKAILNAEMECLVAESSIFFNRIMPSSTTYSCC